MKRSAFLTVFLVLVFCMSCNPGKSADKHVAVEMENKTNVTQSAINDEQEFRNLFEKFKKVIAGESINTASTMLHFPFFTNRNQQENGMGPAGDPISKNEFFTYSHAIFNDDVLRFLSTCNEDNISEIDGLTTEAYYISLKKLTDPGSKMYEVYLQYPETNTNAESFFGFVFGKVNGIFKAMATYTKWPIK